jgi:hypothetical protein
MSVGEEDFDPNVEVDDQQAEEAAEQVYQDEPQYDNSPYSPSMSEAVKRIQIAKLYEALLSQSFFAAGSTRDPEIQDSVENEIKGFIHNRLEELLGMRAEQSPAGPAAQLPFDDEQIEALAYLANRTLKRIPAATPNPVVNVAIAQAPEPQVQQAQVPQLNQMQVPQAVAQPAPQRRAPQRQAAAPQRQQAQQQAAPRPPKPGQRRRRSSENVGERTGKDLSQAVGKRIRPQPMPSQLMMDAMNAQSAELNASGSPVLNQAARAAQQSGGNVSVGAVLAQVLSQSNGGKS